MKNFLFLLLIMLCSLYSCQEGQNSDQTMEETPVEENTMTPMKQNLAKYVPFKLTTDVSQLKDNHKKMIPILIQAAKVMDEIFWYDAYGKKAALMDKVTDEDTRKFVEINYGPWDRLNNNKPFIKGVGPKPAGANFYPVDMSKEEFEQSNLKDKTSLYTYIRRGPEGKLISVPYHEQFPEKVAKVAELLRQASELAEEPMLKKYLSLRSKALLTDEYFESDMAWMSMKENPLDVVIGPIETYEDQLFGYKAAHSSYVLVKDMEWSQRLAKYAAFLPELQKGLPVDPIYKQESPGSDAELNAYDVVYYAGDCNAGSKTIAINLPNDERVQLEKGSRRLQLKNAMRAKFDKILLPISEVLIVEDQRKHITFDAFFSNTMFHEVAHGLGIKNTINDKGSVRESLKEHASALEEGKADILGLYMIQQLHAKGEITGELKDYLVTFMAGIFRSVRFGASSAHGKANMIRFNFFQEQGAFERDAETGLYRVDFEKLAAASEKLSQIILKYQGDGDYAGVGQLVEEKGKIGTQLQADLDRLSDANIPVDVVFEQGVKVLGL